MRNSLHFLAVLLFATTTAHAQNWSAGVSAGPFVDTVTASPFRLEDVTPSPKGVRIQRPQNVHTTVGLRYRF